MDASSILVVGMDSSNGGQALRSTLLNSEGGWEAIEIIPDEVKTIGSFLSIMDSGVFV